MVPVLSLLIPIVVSAVFVFIASSIIHMATPFHKNDVRKLPDEDAVRRAMKEMGSPEFQEKSGSSTETWVQR